jgi:uncharacterized protein YcgL (UPF0745 family)
MKCKVYKNVSRGDQFFILEETKEVSDLPPEIQSQCSKNSIKTIDVVRNVSKIAIDSDEALDHIDRQGYYIANTSITGEEI